MVFQETISPGTTEKDRPQLQEALNALAVEGDELVVAKLDRLGRDQRSVINRLDELQERGIHIRTLDNLVNTKALGKFAPVLIGLLTGLAEVERSLIRERTLESVQHRRETGGKTWRHTHDHPRKGTRPDRHVSKQVAAALLLTSHWN